MSVSNPGPSDATRLSGMTSRTAARRLVLSTTVGLAAATLTVAPAQAAPVFSVAQAGSQAFMHTDDGNCADTDTTPPSDGPMNLVENGPAVTFTSTGSGSYVNNLDAADTGSVTVSSTSRARVSSAGGNLRGFELSTQGSATVTNALGTSACEAHASAGGGIGFAFNVAQAGWLTIQSSSTRFTGIGVSLDAAGGGFEEEQYYVNGSNTRRIFLPAGAYSGDIQASVDAQRFTSGTSAGSAKVSATFAVAGSQSAAPQGKGKKYVGLASARTCGSGAVKAAVTPKKKRAATMDVVTLLVDGKKVAKDKNPKAKKVYTFPATPSKDVTVQALVTLLPVHGKPAKTVTVTASYVACPPVS